MKIVVTGGSGRLGRYLLPELAAQGHGVKVCDLVSPEGPYHWLHVDILNVGELEWAFAGAEVIIHLAAIPHPLNDPPERVFGVNVQGTYNVLEAALRAGARRVVAASSECALGPGFQERELDLHYLPLDEKHPRYPQDPYGLSKAFTEDLCASFTRRSGLETICLRPTYIWFPGSPDEAHYRRVVDNPRLCMKGLWTYVMAQDMATAFRLAAEAPQLPTHAVCAMYRRRIRTRAKRRWRSSTASGPRCPRWTARVWPGKLHSSIAAWSNSFWDFAPSAAGGIGYHRNLNEVKMHARLSRIPCRRTRGASPSVAH